MSDIFTKVKPIALFTFNFESPEKLENAQNQLEEQNYYLSTKLNDYHVLFRIEANPIKAKTEPTYIEILSPKEISIDEYKDMINEILEQQKQYAEAKEAKLQQAKFDMSEEIMGEIKQSQEFDDLVDEFTKGNSIEPIDDFDASDNNLID